LCWFDETLKDLRGPPVEGAAACTADVGALRAREARDAPQVLVQSVGTGDLVVPLTALLSALLNDVSGSGRGNTQHDGSSSSKELHIAGKWKCSRGKVSLTWKERMA
jgi:hypothetical protein